MPKTQSDLKNFEFHFIPKNYHWIGPRYLFLRFPSAMMIDYNRPVDVKGFKRGPMKADVLFLKLSEW